MFFKKKVYIPPPHASVGSYKNFNHLENDLLYTNNEYAFNFLKNKNDEIVKSTKSNIMLIGMEILTKKHIFP